MKRKTHILGSRAAESVAIVALRTGDATDGQNRNVEVGERAGASENVAQETIGGGGDVAARSLVVRSAGLDAGVADAGFAVELGKGEGGGREGGDGEDGELHFEGGGWLVGLVGLSECCCCWLK